MTSLPTSKQKGITYGYCDIVTGQRVYLPSGSVQGSELKEIITQNPTPAVHLPPKTDMYCKLTSWPPLGQSTIVRTSKGAFRIIVLLETSAGNGGESAQVSLWHNYQGYTEWTELILTPATGYDDVLLLNRPINEDLTRKWFVGELPGRPKHNMSVSFTVKFRLTADEDWRWAKDSASIDDGELIFVDRSLSTRADQSLDHFFENTANTIKIQPERPETDDTTLFSLTCPVDGAGQEDSAYAHHRLGKPLHSSRWLGLVRLWSPWLAPRQGKGNIRLDRDGVLLSFLRSDGLHVVCLGVSGINNVVTTFESDENGNVMIKIRSDAAAQGTATVLVAIADDFEVANAAVFYHARKIVADYTALPGTSAASTTETSAEVDASWIEEWYDGLTYCTWNALGQKLSAEKIHHALDELSKHNINITNLIIDDNWQTLSKGETQGKRGWSDFEANPEGFPEGLKKTVSTIREQHPNIKHIAVWHALFGYWGGVDPNGKIAESYKTQAIQIEPGAAKGKMTVVAAEDVQDMYNDFYAFLSAAGVDAVKTDAQFFVDMTLQAPDRRALTVEYQDAWTLAHLRHFSGRAISCMSQTPQIMFHSQLPQNKPRLMVRNSDDFFPDVAASHPWHVFCNAHNSLFMQHLNVLPDWDMFQTSHEWAGFHAAARCVSGGPIYITDSPGKHDLSLIGQMTAQTVLGKTVILRPHVVGKSINPYNSYDANSLLKIGTYVGMARTGAGILGVFNVSGQHQTELISLDAFPGTEEGEYVVGSFSSGTVSQPMRRTEQGSFVGSELEPQGWDILTAFAVQVFDVPSGRVGLANMGLLNKMTGCAAVTGYNVHLESNGRFRIWTSLKALGTLGIWLSDLPERSIANDLMILILGRPIPVHCVRKNSRCQNVLEVDIAKAWEENKEHAGWSNEVSVELFINNRRA